MFPRSFDPRRAMFRAFPFVLLAAVAAVGTVSAAPVTHEKQITIRKSGAAGDTTIVREITIDDEGIRVIGGGKDTGLPRDSDPGRVRVKVDGREISIVDFNGDSLHNVVVHSRGENEIVQFFRDVTIKKGENPGDVVSLFGNVKNFGTIRGDCVAILGSIEQGDSAVILGDAVTIGGAIRELGQGARVDGETVSVGFLPFAGFTIPSVSLLLFFGLFAFVLFVGLAAMFGRLFPERLVGIARTISRRTFLSLALGLVSGPLAFMLALLLLVTVIGIPLALLLPFLYALAAFVGYVASAYLLGCKLLRRPLDPQGGMLAPIAAGTGFVTLFYMVGVPLIAFEGGFRMIGFALLALWIVVGKVCWILGFGALLVSRLGQEADASAKPSTSAAPPSSPPNPSPNPQTM